MCYPTHHSACSWPSTACRPSLKGHFPLFSLSPFLPFCFSSSLVQHSTALVASTFPNFLSFLISKFKLSFLTWLKLFILYTICFGIYIEHHIWPHSLPYLNVPPNVGVQKSAGVSLATGYVLAIGAKQSPRLLRSCFAPSVSC